MANHYLYRDGSGNFKVRANITNTQFYLYTPGSVSSCTGVPGQVSTAFATGILPTFECDSGSSDCEFGAFNIFWTAPTNDGGCEITHYKVGRYIYSLIEPEDASPAYQHGDDANYSYGGLDSEPDTYCLNCAGDVPFCPGVDNIYGSYVTSEVVVTGLTCGKTFNWAVAAVNNSGTGPWKTVTINGGGTGGLGGPNDPITLTVDGYYVNMSYSTVDCDPDYAGTVLSVVVSGYIFNAGDTYAGGDTPVATMSATSRGSLQFLNPISIGIGSGLFTTHIIETFNVYDGGSGNNIYKNTIQKCGDKYWYLEHL